MRIAILTRLIITYPSFIYCFHSEGIRSSWKKPTYCTNIVHQMVNFLELWKHKRKAILISEREVEFHSVVTPTPGVHKNSFRNDRAFHDRIGIWSCWILRRGKNREKNRSEQSREPTANSTHIWRWVQESNQGHIGQVGGERSHLCVIPAPVNHVP